LVRVRIRLHVEIHDHGHPTIGRGIQRVHVVHVIDAAHLLFDWRCDGLLQRLRIRPDVCCLNLNFRWGDVGELGDGKAKDRDNPYNHDDDGDHHGNDGSVDEEL
jgi:hypothetical protein